MSKDDLLILAPMENYETPELPTLSEANPKLLQKVPNRWKNKAMIAATCLSLFSVVPLSGCWGLHHGGAGGGPIYVVHLTEQEALEIVRNQLEQAGLNFDAVPPRYEHTVIYGSSSWEQDISIDLFNAEHQIGIAFIQEWWWNFGNEDERATEIREEAMRYFEEKGIYLGVIFNHKDEVWDHHPRGQGDQFREEFEAYLIEQTQSFIEQLREDGIID